MSENPDLNSAPTATSQSYAKSDIDALEQRLGIYDDDGAVIDNTWSEDESRAILTRLAHLERVRDAAQLVVDAPEIGPWPNAKLDALRDALGLPREEPWVTENLYASLYCSKCKRPMAIVSIQETGTSRRNGHDWPSYGWRYACLDHPDACGTWEKP